MLANDDLEVASASVAPHKANAIRRYLTPARNCIENPYRFLFPRGDRANIGDERIEGCKQAEEPYQAPIQDVDCVVELQVDVAGALPSISELRLTGFEALDPTASAQVLLQIRRLLLGRRR